MKFKKGESGNPAGRAKGVKNKKTLAWEAMGETLIGPWTEAVQKHGTQLIKDGNYRAFLELYKDMVNYFKPKLSSAQVQQDTNINMALSDEELTAQLNKILTAINQAGT